MLARLSTHQDARFPSPEALEGFVREHGRGGLTYRSAQTFREAMDCGVLVAILDEGDTLFAMAGVIPLSEGKFEAGGALVRADMTGFGLQSFMLRARLAAVDRWQVAPWEKIYAGAAHAEYGLGSRRTIEAVGFQPIPYEEGPVELREECQTCRKARPRGEICCYQFYQAGPEAPVYSYEPGRVTLHNRLDSRVLELALPEI